MVFATGDPIFEQKFVYKAWEFRLFCEYEKDYGLVQWMNKMDYVDENIVWDHRNGMRKLLFHEMIRNT